MKDCCEEKSHHKSKKIDYLLTFSLLIIAAAYLFHLKFIDHDSTSWFEHFAHGIFQLINVMWWGVAMGVLMIAILSKIPQEFVIKILGKGGTFSGVVRATLGGIFLDLCSHGILLVASKLYERGASLGQVMAFLIASPWNSFSLTLILIALIGIKWTLAFIILSMLIAIISGVIFDNLVAKKILPENKNKIDLPQNFAFFKEAKKSLKNTKFNLSFFVQALKNGVVESRMVLRWVFLGVIIAAMIRASIDTENFKMFFGPTLAGLGMTVLVATIMEVCSEGTTPIAADILTRARAPGNSFAFLMTGVSTDYTEILVLKETTKSWKISLFLPLVSVPQIVFVAFLINSLS